MQSLTGMTPEELSSRLAAMGQPAWRTRQVFTWVHARLVTGFDGMTDLPAALRKSLAEEMIFTVPEVRERAQSPDGARRLLLELRDGLPVEAVLIPGSKRITACLSSQIGCPLRCSICRTGLAGFRRNLSSDEIVAQFQALQRDCSPDRISNAVFMGMGEPLLNFAAVRDAMAVLTSPWGVGMGTRHITVSTVGIPAGIDKLAQLPGQTGLAVSLHSAVEATRLLLVPASREWGLRELHSAIRRYSSSVNRSVTLEYCLVEGVNDSTGERDALTRFARGLDCKVNIIAYNEIEGLKWKRPTTAALRRFVSELRSAGVNAFERQSRGGSVQGACGQLGGPLLAAPQGTKERSAPTERPERSSSPARSLPRGIHSGAKKTST